MVQNGAEGKEALKECQCGTGLFPYRTPDNSDKLVYLTSQVIHLAALIFTTFFIALLQTQLTTGLLYKYTRSFQKLPKIIKQHCCKVSKFEYIS